VPTVPELTERAVSKLVAAFHTPTDAAARFIAADAADLVDDIVLITHEDREQLCSMLRKMLLQRVRC